MLVKVKFNPGIYADLLADLKPTAIKTVAQNRRYLKIYRRLRDKGDRITPEENEMASLLAQLISSFEQQHYKMPKLTPREALIGHMELNAYTQADIARVVGSRSTVSQILKGKREISKEVAKKLAKFFNTSTDMFL